MAAAPSTRHSKPHLVRRARVLQHRRDRLVAGFVLQRSRATASAASSPPKPQRARSRISWSSACENHGDASKLAVRTRSSDHASAGTAGATRAKRCRAVPAHRSGLFRCSHSAAARLSTWHSNPSPWSTTARTTGARHSNPSMPALSFITGSAAPPLNPEPISASTCARSAVASQGAASKCTTRPPRSVVATAGTIAIAIPARATTPSATVLSPSPASSPTNAPWPATAMTGIPRASYTVMGVPSPSSRSSTHRQGAGCSAASFPMCVIPSFPRCGSPRFDPRTPVRRYS